MDPDRTDPSWRSGNTHGFCVTGGVPPIASEPTPSPRLCAASPDATPVKLCEYYYEGFSIPFKLGTFYLAGNRNFLLGSDMLRHGWCGWGKCGRNGGNLVGPIGVRDRRRGQRRVRRDPGMGGID